MPTRLLPSSVFVWPDRQAVDRAVRRWAGDMARRRPEVRRIGYFGSYARDMWGPGSDVDLLVLVDTSDLPFAVRSRDWDTTALPVPADILIYTMEEWNALPIAGRFARTVAAEVVWVFRREDPGAHHDDRRIGE